MSFLCMYFRHSFLSFASFIKALLSAFCNILFFFLGGGHFLCVNGSHNVFIVIALEVSLLGGTAGPWGKAGVFNKWC